MNFVSRPSAPLMIDFTPKPGRARMSEGAVVYLSVVEVPALLVTRGESTLFGAITVGEQLSSAGEWGNDLARCIGRKFSAQSFTECGVLGAEQALFVLPVQQNPIFEQSLPSPVQSWALRSGLTLDETEGIGEPATIIWGRKLHEGEFMTETIFGLSVVLRLPTTPAEQEGYILEHCSALAEVFGQSAFWVIRSGVAHQYDRS